MHTFCKTFTLLRVLVDSIRLIFLLLAIKTFLIKYIIVTITKVGIKVHGLTIHIARVVASIANAN
jgi:hypothetical protein